MTDKKNIERLFQEKFKDFEVQPAPEAWENIAARLEKKENKKRIFPFWFNAKAAGIAAALVLGFWGLNNYSTLFTPWNSNTETYQNEPVVVQEKTNSSQSASSETSATTSTKSNVAPLSTTPKSSVAATTNTPQGQNNGAAYGTQANQPTNASAATTSQASKNQNTLPTNSNTNIQPSFKYFNNSNEIFVSNEKQPSAKKTNATFEKKSYRSTSTIVSQAKPIVQKTDKANSIRNSISIEKELFDNNQSTATVGKNNIISETNSKKMTSPLVAKDDFKNSIKDKSPIVKTDTGKDVEKTIQFNSAAKRQPNTGVVNNDAGVFQNNEKANTVAASVSNEKESLVKNQRTTAVAVEQNNAVVEGNKSTIADAENKSSISISPNELSTAIVAIDSSKSATVEENPLEKLLREIEKEKLAKNTEEKKEKKKSDWLIKPTVAPIFMFAKNGSPIDEKFVDNAKSYNNTFSVGIGLEKRLSDKFYFRTSVNNLDLSYNTNDIAYYSTLNFGDPSARGLGNVSVNQSALFTTIVDSRDPSFDGAEVLQNKKEGYLNQKISYVEIPFEVSYKLVDKKLGIQVMTGLSTLFLNKNQVSLVSDRFSSDLGEANNLNIIHFSTNIGLGFKYKFFKSFEASVEPTLKYQLFTFHTNAGGFKPYIVGLYSGVSYRF